MNGSIVNFVLCDTPNNMMILDNNISCSKSRKMAHKASVDGRGQGLNVGVFSDPVGGSNVPSFILLSGSLVCPFYAHHYPYFHNTFLIFNHFFETIAIEFPD